MNNTLKHFIESNKNYIKYEEWDSLYDEAYNNLPDYLTGELTTMLSDTLGIDAKQYAKDNIIKQFEDSWHNYRQSHIDEFTLVGFIRTSMNHINGLSYKEFETLVVEFLSNQGSKEPLMDYDVDGDLYLLNRKGK